MSFFYKHRVALGFACLLLAVAVTFAFCFFALSKAAAQSLRLTVVIDAGHGGVDGGVTGTVTGTKESDINLSISRLLQQEFEDLGFYVVQTRPTEAGLYGVATPGYKRRDMEKRAEIIKKNSPAVVISVHQNFFSQTSRRGAQVFFREDVKESVNLARLIQTSLNSMPECVKKTEALAGDYFVLNCARVPAVIVECGFLSNPADEELLTQKSYQEKLVKAIAEGALAFLSTAA
ncbi:MAG: N-acetylmuramoyl-L-alanine amidase [Clostridia bacterium]|nr:N-acetylmuramoyl-L-alanine amidase [Clostridia bacterium]